MLKCTMSRKKDLVKVKCKGTPSELAAEALAMVSAIYLGLAEKSDAAADDFKRIVQADMIDPKSPVWKRMEG